MRRFQLFDGGCYSYLLLIFLNKKSDFKSKGKHLMKKSNVIVFIREFIRIVNISFIILSAYVIKLYIFVFQKMLRRTMSLYVYFFDFVFS